MSRTKRKRYYPIPEAIDGGEWSIDEAPQGAEVSLNKRGSGGTMFVPLGDDDRARFVRFHEMGHVKFSPKQIKNPPEGVPEWVIGAAEDARVNYLLDRQVGFPRDLKKQGFHEVEVLHNAKTALDADDDLFMASLLYSKQDTVDYSDLVLSMFNTIGNPYEEGLTPQETEERERQRKRVQRVERMVSQIHSNFLEWRDERELLNFTQSTLKPAEALCKLFEGKDKTDKKQGKQPGETDEHAEQVEEGLEQMEEWGASRYSPEETDEDGRWGKMEVVELPLARSLPVKMKSADWRASDRGSIPRYMHRYCTDMQVFGTKRRKNGGAVLIDVSGSMSWNHEALMELMGLIPAGVIAMYSGGVESNRGSWPTLGILRIVAKDGKAISTETDPRVMPDGRYCGGDNLIDGPALDWLAQQKGPRYWVSDGHVTGIGGMTTNLLLESVEKCRTGRIVRIPHLNEVKEAIISGGML